MVQTCPVVKWSGLMDEQNKMVVLKLYDKCLFYDHKCSFLNGLPNHMIRPFKNWTKIVCKFKYLGIHMVTVLETVISP